MPLQTLHACIRDKVLIRVYAVQTTLIYNVSLFESLQQKMRDQAVFKHLITGRYR